MDNWAKIEFMFLYKLHLPKHHLRELEFWDVEETLDLWKEQVDKEKEQQDKEQKSYEKQQKATKMAKQPTFKQPSYGGYKIPK